jgi:hypothetical protein
MAQWHAFVMFNDDPEGQKVMGLYVCPTTKDNPRVPLTAYRLLSTAGSVVFPTRKDCLDEAIRYLTAERTVDEADRLRTAAHAASRRPV